MAKGKKITDKVRLLIATIFEQHPNHTAKEIQKIVNDELRKSNPTLSPDWPGLSTVTKVMTPIRKKNKKGVYDPQDKTWSLSSIETYEIPSDILPKLMEAHIKSAMNHRDPFTIRCAKWFSRLYYFSEDKEIIAGWASIYADIERAAEMLGIKNLPSSLLDYTMLSDLSGEKKLSLKTVAEILAIQDFDLKNTMKKLQKLMEKVEL